jgi:hypothetical protein
MTKFKLSLIAMSILAAFSMVACGDDTSDCDTEEVACDAATDEDCSEEGTKEVCIEEDGLNCTDGQVEGVDENGDAACVDAGCAEGEQEVSVDCDAATDEACGEDGTKMVCEAIPVVKYVLVEDTSNLDPGTNYPAADVDAITLIKADGTQLHAANVEDSLSFSDNATDANAVLGAPDATLDDNCTVDATQFFALGHDDVQGGGYVIVSFGEDAAIESGDGIEVHEFGTQCGDQYSDDTYEVRISVASDYAGTWALACTNTGKAICTIP